MCVYVYINYTSYKTHYNYGLRGSAVYAKLIGLKLQVRK